MSAPATLKFDDGLDYDEIKRRMSTRYGFEEDELHLSFKDEQAMRDAYNELTAEHNQHNTTGGQAFDETLDIPLTPDQLKEVADEKQMRAEQMKRMLEHRKEIEELQKALKESIDKAKFEEAAAEAGTDVSYEDYKRSITEGFEEPEDKDAKKKSRKKKT